MVGGNSISERLDPEVVGSVGASWKASAFFAASSGSAVLPKRSVSPFGSVVPLIPVSGIDCAEDSRAFAVTDLDGDGSLDLLLKSRLGPQIRAFQNHWGARPQCHRL